MGRPRPDKDGPARQVDMVPKDGIQPLQVHRERFGQPWQSPACGLVGQEEKNGDESYKVIMAEDNNCFLFWIPLEGTVVSHYAMGDMVYLVC